MEQEHAAPCHFKMFLLKASNDAAFFDSGSKVVQHGNKLRP